ncbi:MAG: hypothetical protein HC895_01180 [Leptolyngbyaceae cyanobacterium SM1_3_5]|nr:hypothetical protein [Leptolyngbyaceae cyanobacterium SM1_3_5]
MSSLRSLLLVAIVVGLALFVAQNWTPVLPFGAVGCADTGNSAGVLDDGRDRSRSDHHDRDFRAVSDHGIYGGSTSVETKGAIAAVSARPDRGLDPRDVPYGVTDSPRTRIQSDDDWEPQPREVWDDWDAQTVSSRRTEPAEQRYRPVEDRSTENRSTEDRPAVDFQMRDREFDRVERIEYRFTDEGRSGDRQDRPDEEPEFYREPDSAPNFGGDNFGSDEPPVYDADYKVYRPAYRPLDEPYEPPYTEPAYSEPEYTEPEYREPEYSESDDREPSYREPSYRNDYPQPPYTEPEPEVWDDWEDEPEPEPPIAPPEPQRPIVEVQQTPKSQYRSGTVYSYSYRGDDEPKIDREAQVEPNRSNEKSTDEPNRVIIPPAPAADDEDWGFEDDPKTARSNDDDW